MTLGEPNERQDNPSAEQEDTSSETLESFTKEQVEEQVRKAKSDALAEVGRLKKSSEDAIKAARAAEERINRMLKEQEEAELEAARDEPDKLTVIRERQARRQAEAKLAQIEQELSEKDKRIKLQEEKEAESTKERNAREIAARFEVDAKRLVKLAKFTDGSLEAIEDIAKDLPKKGETKTLTPDSGKTTGGGQIYKSEEILKTLDPSKMTPQEISDRVKELDKAEREGRIK